MAMSREPRHRSAIGWSSSGRCLAVIDSDHPTAMTGQCGIPCFPFSYTRSHHALHWYVLCLPIMVRRSGQLVTIAYAKEAARAYIATTSWVFVAFDTDGEV